MTRTPTPLPAHLPDRLAITLWDFTWFTRTGPGEPFEDLDAAVRAAVDRGYNALRICAAPFLLSAAAREAGLGTTVRFGPLGGAYAQRVRWYDVRCETTLDVREQLLELFRAAQRHGVVVVASSWEYQQTASFSLDEAWWRALAAVPVEQRPVVLADAHADLVDLLVEHGLDDVLAYTELHNEVQIGHLAGGLPTEPTACLLALRPLLEAGLARFRERHPDRPVTVGYAGIPHAAMRALPDDMDVLAVHPYVYGVLGQLVDELGLRGPVDDVDDDALAPFLLPGAPGVRSWGVPEADAWKLEATIVCRPEIYFHDWADVARVDRWLYERYGEHRRAMDQLLTLWLEVAADWAAAHGVPFVLGEGFVGYTPLEGTFEEGPVGAEICRRAVTEAARLGARGTVVCSNAAPHHPMWGDVALQRECTSLFLVTSPSTTTTSGEDHR